MHAKRRNFYGVLTLTLIASLAVLGCGSTGNSDVRTVNASPGFPNFTVQVGQIGIAASVPYGTEGVQPKGQYSTLDSSGAYRPVGAGANQTILTYVTPGTPLVSIKQSLLRGTAYTIVSYGHSPTMGVVALTDNGTAPASGQFGMRCLNYSSYGPVDVYLTPVGNAPSGAPAVSNLSFNQNAGYAPFTPGTLELQFTPHGSTTVLATAPFSPSSGQLYSVFFMSPAPNTTSYIVLSVNDPISTSKTM